MRISGLPPGGKSGEAMTRVYGCGEGALREQDQDLFGGDALFDHGKQPLGRRGRFSAPGRTGNPDEDFRGGVNEFKLFWRESYARFARMNCHRDIICGIRFVRGSILPVE